jgi:hypothetical protein
MSSSCSANAPASAAAAACFGIGPFRVDAPANAPASAAAAACFETAPPHPPAAASFFVAAAVAAAAPHPAPLAGSRRASRCCSSSSCRASRCCASSCSCASRCCSSPSPATGSCPAPRTGPCLGCAEGGSSGLGPPRTPAAAAVVVSSVAVFVVFATPEIFTHYTNREISGQRGRTSCSRGGWKRGGREGGEDTRRARGKHPYRTTRGKGGGSGRGGCSSHIGNKE